jgi:hypothetical protein
MRWWTMAQIDHLEASFRMHVYGVLGHAEFSGNLLLRNAMDATEHENLTALGR